MATHSSILAWEISWTEEPGRLQSMSCKRVRHNLATKQHPGMTLRYIPEEDQKEYNGLKKENNIYSKK